MLAFLREEVNGFLRDLGVERGFVAPAGKQLVAWSGDRAARRKGECWPSLARLLQHVNVFLAQRRVRIAWRLWRSIELRETQGAGQPGRPAADNDDVGFHLRDVRCLQEVCGRLAFSTQ